MRIRRVALASALLTLTAVDASAFGFDIHVEITRAALAAVLDTLSREAPAERQKLVTDGGVRVSTFSTRALQEIGDANKAMDTDDCGSKGNFRYAARPCQKFGSESWAAYKYLELEPPEEHVDAEKIVESSDLVFKARGDILNFLREGNFIGARKALGRALHAIQDFYSHTNYVELNYRSPNIETRFGESPGSFAKPDGKVRLADENEPTCLEGEYLFTNDLKRRLQALLVETRDDIRTSLLPIFRLGAITKARRIEHALEALEPVLKDPALTSGYYVSDFPTVGVLGALVGDDPNVITVVGKCRHGWAASTDRVGIELGIEFINQAGIHKDFPERAGHFEARTLAIEHTRRFVVDLMKDEELRDDPNVDYVACILGFLGYEQRSVIERVTVGVPGAPNGASWDTAIGSALRFFLEGTNGLKNIQPDILVCMESAHVPGTCAPVCEDADWNIDTEAYECDQTVGPSGLGMLYERDLRVLVRETDRGEPRTPIASFRVEDPALCDPFCSLELEPKRAIWIRFQLKPVTRYGGRYRATAAVLPPRERVPVATPSGGSGSSAPPPTSTGSLGPSGSPDPDSGGPPAPPGGRALTPPPARTPEAIDAALSLRDADNCVGGDAYFPSGDTLAGSAVGRRLGPDQTSRLYQAAALFTVITDSTAKSNLLTAIGSRVDSGDLIDMMNSLSPVQGQAIVSAYQGTTKSFAGQIVGTGLNQLLEPARPASALEPEVSRWIAARLATAPLASEAVDRIFAGPSVSAECTVNQLAKDGFTDAVTGR